ncbi:ATP-dependent protease [Colwellia sp. MT41]|uniref:endopeptidase La n=1 Tax=Colwellia marinimaniae TaxID=1513592 RepID=A0ABQ0MY66_9GAMM|nr:MULTISPECIES: ATP-binding protein [Colwellia]ALO35219.1 ATP-dependent protease [Colwellia sp. MT41]GAW97320.1 ATP-dependent protease [Colwellia marinimaniae]
MTKTFTALADQTRIGVDDLTSPLSASLFSDNQKSASSALDTDSQGFVGHERAKEALAFGLSMSTIGFNVFAMGEHGTGRQTLIKQMLTSLATEKKAPDEWCYTNNFEESHIPLTLSLKPGDGKQLLFSMNKFIDGLLSLFPDVFDNPGYQRQKSAIDREFNKKYDQAISIVEEAALKDNVVLYEENGELGFSPLVDGKPLSDKEFANLKETERTKFYQLLSVLENVLSEQLLELPLWKRLSFDQLRKLKNDTAEKAIKPYLTELEKSFSNNQDVLKYLETVKNHVVDVVLEILVSESDDAPTDKELRKLMVERFLPNLLVPRDESQGAPVIYEQNPSYQNLFGHVDFASFQGSSYTSYRLIRPGALHKANGGYLLLDADKVLSQPMVWSRLKLALKTQQITIENPYSDLSQPNGYSLQPEKIPLQVKVVLLGDAEIYYTLQDYDQEFTELFRVLADFDRHLDKTDSNLIAFGRLIRRRAKQYNYPEVSNEAVLELVRYALRRGEHKHKISANIVQVNDLLDEANYCWQQQGATGNLTAQHIALAQAAKKRRIGRISETWLSEIKERQVLINTEGECLAKVNGLTVLEIGDSVFGTPARITATVYAGSEGVTDIEGEVDLGKSIHSKGVLLLTGYLGHKYGQTFAVNISANIAIEQSYGHIDGDSASMAELCALISAITLLPIDQSLAITGSINQHGEVQSIGGVNEKIEGFFQLCQDKGLTGKQGVIIPQTNVINLMLNDEVIAAVSRGEFSIYAVETIDQALELLMKVDAGVISRTGRYPRKSIHGLALDKLQNFADLLNGAEE